MTLDFLSASRVVRELVHLPVVTPHGLLLLTAGLPAACAVSVKEGHPESICIKGITLEITEAKNLEALTQLLYLALVHAPRLVSTPEETGPDAFALALHEALSRYTTTCQAQGVDLKVLQRLLEAIREAAREALPRHTQLHAAPSEP